MSFFVKLCLSFLLFSPFSAIVIMIDDGDSWLTPVAIIEICSTAALSLIAILRYIWSL